MIVGIPKEIKNNEYRVGIIPVAVEQLCRQGHEVLVQASAGLGSGIEDVDYQKAGARIVRTALENLAMRAGLNLVEGKIVLPQIAKPFGLKTHTLKDLLA